MADAVTDAIAAAAIAAADPVSDERAPDDHSGAISDIVAGAAADTVYL